MASTRPPGTVQSAVVLKGAAIWLCALTCFAAFRWWARLEPLNSDDLVLFGSMKDAASGNHWLFSSEPLLAGHRDALCLSCSAGGMSHQALRIGLLPVALPVLYWLGPTLTAYYVIPLFFQLLGSVAVWLLIRRYASRGAAWLGFGLLTIMPYELAHASLFLVDLPAAACLLWALWALDTEYLGTRTARGLVAGAFITWAYFLRENTPILLVPGLALLAIRREYRRSVGIALATWAVGFGLEQWLYVHKGLGFGYRSRIIARALETYSPQLPVYSFGAFAYRYFASFWRLFGGFPLGALACCFLLGTLGVLGWLLLRQKTDCLRALAACGLATWCIFAYAPFRIEGAQIQALAPPVPRYVQPLLYAGLIAGLISLDRGWQSIRAGAWAHRRRPLGWGLCALLGLLAAAWLVWDVHALKRLRRPNAPLSTALDTLVMVAGEAAARGSLEVWGPPLEIRVLELVSAQQTPALRWHEAELPALLERLEREPDTLVVRDPSRELSSQHYLEAEPQRARRQLNQGVDELLWGTHQSVGLASGYAIFLPAHGVCQLQHWPTPAWQPSADPAPFALTRAVSYRLAIHSGEPLPVGSEECATCTYALRFEVRLDAGATGKLKVEALAPGHGPKALAPAQDVASGANYFSWRAPPRTKQVRVELELTPTAGSAGLVALGPMDVRRCAGPPGLPLEATR